MDSACPRPIRSDPDRIEDRAAALRQKTEQEAARKQAEEEDQEVHEALMSFKKKETERQRKAAEKKEADDEAEEIRLQVKRFKEAEREREREREEDAARTKEDKERRIKEQDEAARRKKEEEDAARRHAVADKRADEPKMRVQETVSQVKQTADRGKTGMSVCVCLICLGRRSVFKVCSSSSKKIDVAQFDVHPKSDTETTNVSAAMSHHDSGKELKERKVRLSTEAVQKATQQEAMLKQAAEAAARTEKVQKEEQSRRAAAEKLAAARKQAEEQEAEAIRKQLEEFQKKRMQKEKEITRQAEEQEAEEIRKEIERFKQKEQLRQRELQHDKDPLTKREQAKEKDKESERERERAREREAAAEEGKRKPDEQQQKRKTEEERQAAEAARKKAEEEAQRDKERNRMAAEAEGRKKAEEERKKKAEEEPQAAEAARKKIEETKQREEERKRELAKKVDDSAQERDQLQAAEPAAKVCATGNSNVDFYLRQIRSTAPTETSPRSPPGSRTTSSSGVKTKHNTTVGYDRDMDSSPLPTVIAGQPVVDKKMESGGKAASESIRERVMKGPTPDKGAASPHMQQATVESPRPLTFNSDVQPLTIAGVIGKLKDVVSFFDQGLFSKEEFSQRRQEILGNVEQPALSASPTPLQQSVSKSPLQSSRVPSQNSVQLELTFKDFVNQSSGAKASPAVRAAAASPQKSEAAPPGFRRGASAKVPGQLWDDAAFSRTLVAAAAKLSAMQKVHAVPSSPRNESHQSLYSSQLGHKTPVVASGPQSAGTRQKEPNLFASLSPSPSPSLSSETRQKEPNLFAARDSSFYERLAESSPAPSPRATSILRGNILDMPMQALTKTVTSVVTQSCVLTLADSDAVLFAIPN